MTILAVRYDDDKIEKCIIPIHKDENTIDEIYRMVDDDAYDVDDIKNLFRRKYGDNGMACIFISLNSVLKLPC